MYCLNNALSFFLSSSSQAHIQTVSCFTWYNHNLFFSEIFFDVSCRCWINSFKDFWELGLKIPVSKKLQNDESHLKAKYSFNFVLTLFVELLQGIQPLNMEDQLGCFHLLLNIFVLVEATISMPFPTLDC